MVGKVIDFVIIFGFLVLAILTLTGTFDLLPDKEIQVGVFVALSLANLALTKHRR